MDKAFDWEAERQRIIIEVKKRLDELFPHKLHFPTCWRCQQEMCEVLKRNEPNYFQCFEVGCNGRKEWSI